MGFKSPLLVCCGSRGGKYNFNGSKPCGLSPLCSDPSVKVFWDGGHYTKAANKLVFDMLNIGEFSDPLVPTRFACQLNA
ncbi:unnamed protein product [Ilex paraguariensis]|uniref:GDSL esterase/lipase n=1 Tax=Ilex paraguariensis TaxID=185542 RepID=A0ABC8T6D6_9AQUA